MGDLEVGYSRFGKAVEGDGVEISGPGPGTGNVESFGPDDSAENGRKPTVMFHGVLGGIQSLGVVVEIQRGIRSGVRIILMQGSNFLLGLSLDN